MVLQGSPMKAIPYEGDAYTKVCAKYEKRELHILFGYKERESIRIRLEPSNDKVYVDYVNSDTRVWQAKWMALEDFVELIKGVATP